MKSRDNPKCLMEIPREAEATSFDFDFMPWVDEYDHVVESGLDTCQKIHSSKYRTPDSSFDAVVSTYAFHHIPHYRQPEGIREMVRVLRPGGVWAMGEVAFRDAAAELEAKRTYPWLDEDEYYPHIDSLQSAFNQFNMGLHGKKFTPVSWVLWALKPAGDGDAGR